VIWHELCASDLDAATRFYAELLGGEIEGADMGEYEHPVLKKGISRSTKRR
jgi:predicted enzyme related to lactoylglutathione lyase